MNRSMKAILGIFVLTSLLSGSFVVPPFVHAEETSTSLQEQLKQIEAQIAADQAQAALLKGQANTLANALSRLKLNAHALELQLDAADLQLTSIARELDTTEQAMALNESRRTLLRSSMAELLRAINVNDREPPLFAFLRTGNVSDAINDAREDLRLAHSLQETSVEVQALSATLATQHLELERAQEESLNLLALRLAQQETLRQNQIQQQNLLSGTQEQIEDVQMAINSDKAEAARIRTRIYQLLEVEKNVTFEQAVQTANWASGATGIRPAFLLSILSQESSLGANVGRCNRVGDPPTKHWTAVMKPTRDQEPFKVIMEALGRSTEGTPVSCPLIDKQGNRVGWGGAMGPAQFIPSTWIEYQEDIQAITGRAPDPWDIRDAFLAAAIKLMNDGADGGEEGEWAAAMRYFSGSTDTRFRFYGDQVMDRAEQYEKDIETIGN